jgi:hypothetical protein
LKNREHFLNSICNTVPQFLPHTDSTGQLIAGLFPQLSDVLGPNSFDHFNRDTRWRHFLSSSSSIAAEFANQYTKGKTIHQSIIQELVTQHVPAMDRFLSIYDTPLEGFGADTIKIQRLIQNERQDLQFKLLTQRAKAISSDDPRRLAFFANSTDAFACKLLGNLPHAQVKFSPREFTTAVALHMGIRIPSLKAFVDDPILNNSKSPPLSVDPHGYNLTTVTGIKGGGTQTNHNTICTFLSSGLTDASIKHLGGKTDRSCKSIFRDAIPPQHSVRANSDAQIKSIVADLFIMTKTHTSSPLGGADHIIDVKTLAVGQKYRTQSTCFGHAVATRQAKVNSDYHKTAADLDRKFHSTTPGSRGPFAAVLNEHGYGGRVLGPVIGAFGEASSDLHDLRDLIAIEQATSHMDFYRCTAAQGRQLFQHQINRKWGHSIARGWSRLILDRLRDYVGPQFQDNRRTRTSPSDDTGNVNEAFHFFNSHHRVGVSHSRHSD